MNSKQRLVLSLSLAFLAGVIYGTVVTRIMVSREAHAKQQEVQGP